MAAEFTGPTDDITNDPLFQQNSAAMSDKILFLMCRFLEKMDGYGMTVDKTKFEAISVDTSAFAPDAFAEDIRDMYTVLKRISILYAGKYPDEKDVVTPQYLFQLRDTENEGASFQKYKVGLNLNEQGDKVIIQMTKA